MYINKILPWYYDRFFPHENYYKWLSYGKNENFQNREFSFNKAKYDREEIVLRYQAFDGVQEFRKALRRELPMKIDLGAVYNVKPAEKKNVDYFSPVQQELLFDIDMNDYDEIRSCCSGANVCEKCWKFVSIACRILDTALREDFGFKHILWTFSGRRGVHARVCDATARKLNDKQRDAILTYLTLINGDSLIKKRVNLGDGKIAPCIRRALDIIEPRFFNMCVCEQMMLGSKERIEQFLGVIIDRAEREKIESILEERKEGVDRWFAFVKYVESQKERKEYCYLLEEVMLQYCYPRLDARVTVKQGHLLKAPFSLHPKTEKICIPFDPKHVDHFNPTAVPRLEQIVNTLDTNDRSPIHIFDESLQIFDRFVRNLQSDIAADST